LQTNYNLCPLFDAMGCGSSLVSKNIFKFIELRVYKKFVGVARKMQVLKNVTKLTA